EIKRDAPSLNSRNIPDEEIVERLFVYEHAGIRALSILTEPEYFKGKFTDITLARQATRLPVLCKDFTITIEQVDLAAIHGASAILIIAKIPESLELIPTCLDKGLTPLVEIHDSRDLEAMLPFVDGLEENIIFGINNRDLETMTIDIKRSAKLINRLTQVVGNGALIVSESGIHSRSDIKFLTRSGMSVFLIGTALMVRPVLELERFIHSLRLDILEHGGEHHA
ncbi:hypothetical protein GF325_04335, partial [Candidatus Bathyarchaeota archaeon]|nr:hypothetical protein [Candidatus Bathyarchaeota archaeon]